jgi:hypothetical protein
MRHPKRASWPRRREAVRAGLLSTAAAAAALLLAVLAPAAALADREEPRSASRERGASSGDRTAVPRSSTPSTPSTPSSPSARSPERGTSDPGSAARVPDDRRGDRRDRAEDRHRHRGSDPWYWHNPYYPYYSGWYGGYWSSIFWGHYGWPWYYPAPYGYGYGDYGRYGGYGHYGRRASDFDLGALDLDVSPAKTEVYVDGEYLGRVDSFDGFPQYLWLEDGTYDLVLFREGYQTIARQVTVRPGIVMQVDHELERGESVRPENLGTKSHVRRDRRLRYEREAREGAGEMDDDEEEMKDEAEEQDADSGREAAAEAAEAAAEEAGDGRESVRRDARTDPGRVRLEVRPEDASVYLDGRFLGTGSELGRLHSGLLVDRGEHRLAVVRPGYRQRELEFEVEAGEELELEVELEPGS